MRRLLAGLAVLIVLVVIAWGVLQAVLASDLVRSSLEQQLTAATGRPARIGSARAEVFPRVTLALGDVVIGDPPEVRLGTVRVVTGLRPLFSRTIDDAEVVVSDGELPFPPPLPVPNASPGTAAEDSPAPFTVRSIQRLALRDVRLVRGDAVIDVDLESAVRGDRLDISSLVLRTSRTRLEASGAVSSISRVEGEFHARADPLDVEELAAIAVAAGDTAVSADRREAAPGGLHVTVHLTAPSASFGSYAVADLETTIEVTSGRVHLNPMALQFAGGELRGRIEVLTSSQPAALRVAGELRGFDIVELMKHSGAAGGVTGRLSGSVELGANAGELTELLQSASGTVLAMVTDGTLPGIDLVRPIVLAFGRPSGMPEPPEGSGSAFSRLGGTFALAGGRLSSTDLTLMSRDVDAVGRGTLNLISGAIEAAVDLVLSKELSQQAGTDLVRYTQEEGRVTIPATVTGTLQRATISLDLVAAGRRAVGNELRRRTKSLLEDLLGKPR